MKNGGDAKSEGIAKKKVAWDPNYEDPNDLKRKRKKKQSYMQKFQEEWDELAAEENLFKKFRKGKLNKEDYDEMLASDNVQGFQKRKASTSEENIGSGSDVEEDQF